MQPNLASVFSVYYPKTTSQFKMVHKHDNVYIAAPNSNKMKNVILLSSLWPESQYADSNKCLRLWHMKQRKVEHLSANPDSLN